MTLWPHQKHALDLLERLPGVGLWLDMGVGKSRVIVEYHAKHQPRRTLIVAPKSVLGVWPDQFRQWHSGPRPRLVVLDKGSARIKADRIPEAGVVVVNYESVWREPLGAKLMSWRPDLLVCDESHRAKSPTGAASKFLGRLARRSAKRACLSGTPCPHSPLDAWAQYRIINPTVFGTRFVPYRARYAVLQKSYGSGGRQYDEIVGWQNQDEWRERYSKCSTTVASDDVLDLPPEQDVWLWADLEPRARKVYADLARHLIAELEGDGGRNGGGGTLVATNALVKLLRLQQIVGGTVRDADGADTTVSTAKADLLSDWLTDVPPAEPVIVFCRFRSELDTAREVLQAARRKNIGELSGRLKDLVVDGRMRDDLDSGVVQIQAGGVGIDLTRSRYAVYWSTGWSLGDYLQSRARLHRPGQARPVTYYHLGVRDSIDDHLRQALAARSELVESFVRGSAK